MIWKITRPILVYASCLSIMVAMLAGLALAQEADTTEQQPYAKDASTEINVKNADIAAVIRIFSKKTKRNYILDERVKGKISIYLPGKVSSDEAIRILDSVLALKNFTAVPIGENLWKIVPSKEAIQSTIPTIMDETGESPSAAMVTRLLPLKYVGADDAQRLMSPLISSNGLINAYTGTNSLIIIDSEDNVERVVKIIHSLDLPFSDREMTIIPIKHAAAADIADKLNEILGEGSSDSSSTSSGVPGALESIRARLREGVSGRTTSSSRVNAAKANKGASSSTTISPRSREPKIISDERTNSVIIVADEDTTARIRALVSQLDSEVDLSGYRFYVYRCQHSDAEELADVLSGLDSDGGGASSGSSSASPFGGESGRNTRSRDRGDRFSRTQDRLSSQQRTPGRSRSENGGGSGLTSSFNLGEDMSISADPATNSLIIYASKADYEKLKELLKQLDIKRRQVLVEAMLLEVQIDDSVFTSTEFLSSAGGQDGGVLAKSSFDNNLATLIQDPVALSNFSIAAASSGTLTLPGDITIPTQTILLNAAQTNSNVNVLSAPNILATDNEEAEIIVGQNVPFLASTSTSGDNLNNTFNQIDRQDVGITLRITPQISSGDFVRLDIFTEVSNVIAATLTSELGPTTTLRTSETTVSTKNGQMIVIGGLMGDDMSESDSGIPYLKNIPVLGHLFRTSTVAKKQTNLLIFITPRIIQDQFDARDATMLHRERTEEVMDAYEVYPKRREVLRSPDMDRVTEPVEYIGEQPGIIRPPQQVTKLEKKAIVASGSAPIELKVSPKLPDQPPAPAFKESGAEGKAQLKPEVHVSAKGERYIVFELNKNSKQAGKLPFALGPESKFVGIIVPPESSVFAKNFFQVGQSYRYQTIDGQTSVKSIGVFANNVDAVELFPELQTNWYTLSPFEIMSLGKRPWTKIE
ncbi:type II secretion system secretin GspD [Oligoflexia bacterium]|nr:type II secretion system secretin GspD [Oligoflexia bacterium]